MKLILCCLEADKTNESTQAFATYMKLMSWEGKYPIEQTDNYSFPTNRLRNILTKLVSNKKISTNLIKKFKEYTDYLDIVYHSWKLMNSLGSKTAFQNENFAQNYLELINSLPVTNNIQKAQKLFCSLEKPQSENFEYAVTRKCINKVWSCIMQWGEMKESIHKQVLIVLLERILPHLEKPVLLTDFLMDSLDYGNLLNLIFCKY